MNQRSACVCGLGILAVVLTVAGCASTPKAPPDEELRSSATKYIRWAIRYPDSPAVRAQAIEVAVEVSEPDIKLLIREGLGDEHAGVRFAACMALGKLRDIGAMADVRKLLNDPDPNVRIGTYYALERMGDISFRRSWRDMLRNHDDPAVRRNAALALGLLEDNKVMRLLQQAASTDHDDGVRLQALEALVFLGDRDASSRFIHDAYGGLGFRQPFALLVLGRSNDDRVIPALRNRLANAPYLESNLAAARSLGMQGLSDGYQLALSSLSWNKPDKNLADDSPSNQIMRVRTMAALALGDIGDRRALKALKQRANDSADPRVQLAAVRAILMILKESPSSGGIRRISRTQPSVP